MGCTTSSTKNTNNVAWNNHYLVEIAGAEKGDIELMVERREIYRYRVVDLKKEIPDEHKDFMLRLENPRAHTEPVS